MDENQLGNPFYPTHQLQLGRIELEEKSLFPFYFCHCEQLKVKQKAIETQTLSKPKNSDLGRGIDNLLGIQEFLEAIAEEVGFRKPSSFATPNVKVRGCALAQSQPEGRT
jgi:hypothetical protein